MKTQIIRITIFLLLAIISICIGLSLDRSIENFCHERYLNKTFMNTMDGYGPYYPKECTPNEWRVHGFCNNSCQNNYNACLEYNVTGEQRTFSRSCGWRMSDWRSFVGFCFLTFFLPLVCLMLVLSILFSSKKEDK